MNKKELIEAVVGKTNLNKTAASAVLEAVLESITEGVAKGDKVSILGFGTFEARARAARQGFNPLTKVKVKIPATVVPAFKPGKAFKDRLSAKKGKK